MNLGYRNLWSEDNILSVNQTQNKELTQKCATTYNTKNQIGCSSIKPVVRGIVRHIQGLLSALNGVYITLYYYKSHESCKTWQLVTNNKWVYSTGTPNCMIWKIRNHSTTWYLYIYRFTLCARKFYSTNRPDKKLKLQGEWTLWNLVFVFLVLTIIQWYAGRV